MTQLLENFVVYLEQLQYEYLEHFEYGTFVNVMKSKHRSRISNEKKKRNRLIDREDRLTAVRGERVGRLGEKGKGIKKKQNR